MSGALKRETKKGVTQEDGRRRREATTVALRKEKRDEGVSKRRMVASAASAAAPMMAEELSLDNLPAYCAGEHWWWAGGRDGAGGWGGRRRWRAKRVLVQRGGLYIPCTIPRGAGHLCHYPVSSQSHFPRSYACTLPPPPPFPLPSPRPAAARSDSPARQLEGVTAIRRLLSKESRPPVEPVMATGILPRLVELLAASGDAKTQFEAAWAITNIASTEHTRVVVDGGAVPALVQGMMSADPAVRDQCVWCIGNIAGDCTRYRDLLFATPGALQALMLNIQHPGSAALLGNATWALSNFCRGKPSPPLALAQPLLPALAWLLTQSEPSVVSDAAWGLSYLTDGDE